MSCFFGFHNSFIHSSINLLPFILLGVALWSIYSVLFTLISLGLKVKTQLWTIFTTYKNITYGFILMWSLKEVKQVSATQYTSTKWIIKIKIKHLSSQLSSNKKQSGKLDAFYSLLLCLHQIWIGICWITTVLCLSHLFMPSQF